LELILGADPEERGAYLTGLAKNKQQVILYTLYGQVDNYMSEKVFTRHDSFQQTKSNYI
jgi:hypothetical protein